MLALPGPVLVTDDVKPRHAMHREPARKQIHTGVIVAAVGAIGQGDQKVCSKFSGHIRRTQDILGRRIAVENVSYYAAPGKEMEEIDFITAVLEEADCDLLLDVNNIYVNSINHRYDAGAFLAALPGQRIAYIHTAGHYVEAEDLRVDTHGAPVTDPVWQLLDKAYAHFGVIPTLLERDFNIPPLAELLGEIDHILEIQTNWGSEIGSRAIQNS